MNVPYAAGTRTQHCFHNSGRFERVLLAITGVVSKKCQSRQRRRDNSALGLSRRQRASLRPFPAGAGREIPVRGAQAPRRCPPAQARKPRGARPLGVEKRAPAPHQRAFADEAQHQSSRLSKANRPRGSGTSARRGKPTPTSIYFADAPLATVFVAGSCAGSHRRSDRRSVPGPRGRAGAAGRGGAKSDTVMARDMLSRVRTIRGLYAPRLASGNGDHGRVFQC